VTASRVCPQCGTEYPANARFCETDGSALRNVAPSADLVGAIVAERYCVLRKLGEGGMGEVYLAEHVKMGRKSALKVLHPGMVSDVDAISRFNREAANASRINHPNVAAVYDFGETPDGLIYLAMEFVDGPSLTTLIAEQGALAPTRAAEIVRQAADALAAAHDMGIVHRDLKPDNIMLARTRDGGDLVKVVDFGIAKAAGNTAQNVTKTGLVVGTPAYMSPEQLAGDTLDGRSDIYSLALVAFNMLTGTLPFPSDSAQESMIMRLTDQPKTLAEMRPEVPWPADVQAAMDRALERLAPDRYQSAAEFGHALQRAVERMPESRASAARTVVLDTAGVPPTRVASEPAAAPTPGPRSRLTPVVGAIAAIAVVAAITAVAAPKLIGHRAPIVPAGLPASAVGHAAGPVTHPTDTVARGAARPGATKDSADQIEPTAPATPSATPIEFAALEGLAKDSANARRALRELAAESSRIISPDDSVHGAIVIYFAQLSLGGADTLAASRACSTLASIRTIAARTSQASRVEGFLGACEFRL
jgi:serine/threonine-protein kinase